MTRCLRATRLTDLSEASDKRPGTIYSGLIVVRVLHSVSSQNKAIGFGTFNIIRRTHGTKLLLAAGEIGKNRDRSTSYTNFSSSIYVSLASSVVRQGDEDSHHKPRITS